MKKINSISPLTYILYDFTCYRMLWIHFRHIENTAQSNGGHSHNKPNPRMVGAIRQQAVIKNPMILLLNIGKNSLLSAKPIRKKAKLTPRLYVLIQPSKPEFWTESPLAALHLNTKNEVTNWLSQDRAISITILFLEIFLINGSNREYIHYHRLPIERKAEA